MAKIPDLQFVVVRSRTVFTRCGHLTVFYRHDKDGKPFIYHVVSHYGNDRKKTFANAKHLGTNVVNRKQNMGLRDTFIKCEDRPTIRAKGLNPDYCG